MEQHIWTILQWIVSLLTAVWMVNYKLQVDRRRETEDGRFANIERELSALTLKAVNCEIHNAAHDVKIATIEGRQSEIKRETNELLSKLESKIDKLVDKLDEALDKHFERKS